MNKISLKKINTKTLFFFFALLGLSFFVYGDVLFGNYVYLTKKYAMDLYNQFFPQLLTLSRQISKGELFEHIDFTNGLGHKVSVLPYRITYLPAFFGEKNVVYLLAFFQTAKIVLAGLFFYLFLKKVCKDEYAAMIGGLGYAFCGPMILRQFWAFYSLEIFLVALWLYSFELYIDKKKGLFPFATLFLFLNCNTYYIVIYVGVLFAYIFIRLFSDSIKISKKSLVFIVSFILVSAIISIGVMDLLKTFSMVSNKMSEVSGVASQKSMFKESLVTDFNTFIVSFLQTIGLGIVSSKILNSAFLGSPTFYCGIITFITLPLLAVYLKGKKRVVYIISLILALVYFVFVPIRVLANAKVGDHFKMSSLWIILIMLFIAIQSLAHYFASPEKRALMIVEIMLAIIFVLCLACAIAFGTDIYISNMIGMFALLIIYGMLFYLYYKREEHRIIIKEMILLVILFETAFFSKAFLQYNVDFMDKSQYETIGFNDVNTSAAIKYIYENDEKKNFRIDKQYFDYLFCDSEAFDYYGSSYYIGAMGDLDEVREFYNTMKLATYGVNKNSDEYMYKKAYGTSLYTELNEILGFKYIISTDPYIANFGYGSQYKKQFDNVFVFENEYALPMVFGYNKVVSDKEFEKLTTYEKHKALMRCCVVPEDKIGEFDKDMVLKSDDLKIDMSQFRKYKSKSFSESDSKYSTGEVFNECTVLVKAEFDLEEPIYRAMLNHNFVNGFSGSYYVRLDEGKNVYYFELNSQYISNIWFTDFTGEIITPEKCEFYVIPWDVYYKDYVENYKELNDNISKVDTFSGTFVNGKIDMVNDGFLFFSAPYGDWKLYIDGEEAEIIRSNVAFMGAKVSKGYHTYRFVYKNGDSISKDELIKIVSLSAAILWGIIYGIVRKAKKKNEVVEENTESN